MAGEEELKNQLYDLQSQVAFQEDTISTLNNIVTEQQQQIERLNEMLNQLKLQVEAAAEGDQGNATVIERPPHY